MQKVSSRDGTSIAFDRSGKGPAVILVGGAFQHRAIDARTAQLASLLAEHFTVFHYDRRGRGDSGDTQPYAIARELEDLKSLIKEAGGSAYVFGMSSGAVLALRAAAQNLDIKKLALYEPPFNNPGDRSPAMESYTKDLTTLLAEGRRGDAVALALAAFGAPAEAVVGMQATPIWPIFESVAPTLAYDNAIMGDGSVPVDEAKKVRIPVLVMDGGASPAGMRNATQAVVDALPNSKRRTLEGQTHDVEPEALAPVLVEFYKSGWTASHQGAQVWLEK